MDRMAKSLNNVVSFGFVDNMDELMDAADIVVGKAGGLTLSESLAKRKPFFILSPVPGQEHSNAEVLTKANASFWVKEAGELAKMIENYMNNRAKHEHILRGIDGIARPDSAENVARMVLRISPKL